MSEERTDGNEPEISAESEHGWFEREAVPAIRHGVNVGAAKCIPPLTTEEREDAFQNASIAAWYSPKVQADAALEKWDDVRAFAYTTGYHDAIEVCRNPYRRHKARVPSRDDEQPTNEDVEIPQRDKEQNPTATDAYLEEMRRLLREVLPRLRVLVPRLSDEPRHPHRTIMLLSLQLLQQEQHEQGWEGLIDLLGLPPSELAPPWPRRDKQIATILRPDDMDGEQATDNTRQQAAQWVRTELKHARHELRGLYELHFGPLPLSIDQLEGILDESENDDE